MSSLGETTALERCSFGDDFFWGGGSAAYQFEGAADKYGRGLSIWDTFTHKWPGKMLGGSNGTRAVDFYHRYKEDVQILKNIGFNAFRISISWSRILPNGKISGGLNREGINFYHGLIDELLLNGITPFVTLFHWDLPQDLESEYKGFLSTQIVPDFCDFANLCFWEYGRKVRNWITVNDPWSYSIGGYVSGRLAPGRGPPSTLTPLNSSSGSKNSSPEEKTFTGIRTHRNFTTEEQDEIPPGTRPHRLTPSQEEEWSLENGNVGTEPYIVAHNLLLAHAAAVQLYRDKYQAVQKGQIGIALHSNWFEPLDPTSKDDLKAADRAKDFMFGWFMEPLTKGTYPKSMQDRVDQDRLKSLEDLPYKIEKSFDFIGINYYTAQYVSNSPKPSRDKNHSYDTDSEVKTTYSRDGVPIGDKSGFEWLYSYPKGMGDLLRWITDKYADENLAIYITENGICEYYDVKKTIKEACLDTKMRISYHKHHLMHLNEAMKIIKKKGVDVKGYFVWSFLDNFEWNGGYNIRFGLIHVDLKDEYLERYPKDSARWFMNFLKEDADTTLPNSAKKTLAK